MGYFISVKKNIVEKKQGSPLSDLHAVQKEPHEKIENTCLLIPGAAFVANFQCIVHIYLFVSPSHPAVQACTGAGRTAPWPGCSSRRRSRTWRPSCWARRGPRTRPHREGPAKRSSRCRGPPRPRSGRTSRAEIHIYFDIFFVHALPPTTTNCCFVSDQDREHLISLGRSSGWV